MSRPVKISDSRLPSYLRVCEVLLDRIRNGDYRCGEFLPPERSLCAELGVSRVTLRQAIDALKQDGIVAPEQGRGTRIVCEVKRGETRPGQFELAALVVYGIARDGSGRVLGGCQEVLSQSGYHLILCETPREAGERAAIEAAHLRSLIDKGIRGIIIYPTSENRELLEEALAKGIQIVQIDRFISGLDADYVGVDNQNAAETIVEHLCRLGHRRIAFFTLWPEPSTCQERLKGYRAGLREHGLPDLETELLAYCDTYIPVETCVEKAVEGWMSLPESPTAIFAANDRLAVLVMQSLQRHGIRVPDDMAVVGFDNEQLARFVSPPLTTVQQPFRALGETSARLLLERMKGSYRGVPRRVLLPTKLVIRKSSGPPDQTAHPSAITGPKHMEPVKRVS